jgi:gluconolactonase
MTYGGSGLIFPSDAELRTEFDGGFWLEGPSQGPDGRIYFSDMTTTWMSGMQGGHLLAWDPATRTTEVFLSPSSMSNGIVFDGKGRMIVAHGADFGGRCVSRIDMNTRRSTIIAGLFNGKPFNAPNDVDVDAEDRVYFTDPRYIGHEAIEQPVMGVYRIDTDGAVELVVAECSRPNGVAVSPDGRHLYVVENNFVWFDRRTVSDLPPRFIEVQIVRYDIQAGGKLGNRQVFVDVASEGGGGPDGIEVDSEGNVYAAMLTATAGVRVYSPDGREIDRVNTPLRPANLTLARDADGSVRMFIAASTSLLSIPANVPPRRF